MQSTTKPIHSNTDWPTRKVKFWWHRQQIVDQNLLCRHCTLEAIILIVHKICKSVHISSDWIPVQKSMRGTGFPHPPVHVPSVDSWTCATIRYYLLDHLVINVIFLLLFPGYKTLVLLLLGAKTIFGSAAPPIVLLSHGSQWVLSNYNLARFLSASRPN